MARPRNEKIDVSKPAEPTEEQIRLDYEKQVKAAQRMIVMKKAQTGLIDFTRLMMPDPTDPDDSSKSRYEVNLHHQCIAAALEEVEKGSELRVIITLPPRAGKSELAAKKFIPWILGKDPYRQIIFATYNETFSEDTGRSVRDLMQSKIYKQVFPLCNLAKGSAAANRIQCKEGGMAAFVGAGGAITGRGADFLIIDDIIKDAEQAASAAERNKIWEWFTSVAMTRLMGLSSRVIIIMTRWHDDDLVGRLTDEKNPCFNLEEAKKWKMIHVPAIAEDDDVLGRKAGESLWPSRFPMAFLESARRLNPRSFSALYQGKPSPEDGDFFKRENIVLYKPNQLPGNLRIYAASDHAVSLKQGRDRTCAGCVGVDREDNIWILSDLFWKQAKTDEVVEAMINLMGRHKPIFWWAEKGHISDSIGPFLRKRMRETKTYCSIIEMTPTKDKMTRSQSIQARMSMGKVFFPDWMGWTQEAITELLKFPSATHDDFVDFISWVGIGLNLQSTAGTAKPKEAEPAPGSLAWFKAMTKQQERDLCVNTKDGY